MAKVCNEWYESYMSQGQHYVAVFSAMCIMVAIACSNDEISSGSEQGGQAGGLGGESGAAGQGGEGGQAGSNQAGSSGTSAENQTLLACRGGPESPDCEGFSGNIVDIIDSNNLAHLGYYGELAIFEEDCPSSYALAFHKYQGAINTQIISGTQKFQTVSGLPSKVSVAMFYRTEQCETIAFGCSPATLPSSTVIPVEVFGIFNNGKLSPLPICEEGVACDNGSCAKLSANSKPVGSTTISRHSPCRSVRYAHTWGEGSGAVGHVRVEGEAKRGSMERERGAASNPV